MSTIWIGDFRSKALQSFAVSDTDDIYIIENSAEYSWFKNSAVRQLESLITTDTSSIVILLGFNDCVNSSTWKNLQLKTAIDTYITELNNLVSKYSQNKFYVCSVTPVSDDYETPSIRTGFISKTALNNNIKSFNSKLKEKCKATYLDTYSYFYNTDLKSYDGVHYTNTTSVYLQNYILNHINTSTVYVDSQPFDVREEAPSKDDYHYYSENPFEQSDYGMPNCTAYAWGRFYEILGEPPKLSLWNAEYWYLKDGKHVDSFVNSQGKIDYNAGAADGYERGQEPRPGAIICWQDGSIGGSAGHVAFVEKLNKDGSILISEDGASIGWRLNTLNKGSDGNWGYSSYKFQGFIYNPAINAENKITVVIDKSQVTSSNESLLKSVSGAELWDPARWTPEIKLNAQYIWQYFNNKKWTLNAVAGMLGNMQTESYINPGVWQNFREWGTAASHGYGLVQWTPYTKYTDWCTKNNYDMYDIDTALLRIEKEVEANASPGWSELDQWIPTSKYNMSFSDFTKSELPAYELGKAFVLNYERPGDQSESHLHIRGKQAESWYNFLSQYAVEAVPVLSLKNLKIDLNTPTMIKASFISASGKSANYNIINYKGLQQDSGGLSLKSIDKVTTFSSMNLVPNTEYKLTVEVIGSSDSDTVQDTISFTTSQDYPESVTGIKLSLEDSKKLESPDGSFIAKISQPIDWGYWKKNSYGYELHLLVNGKSVMTKNIVVTNTYKFIPSKINKDISIADTIQIGVRTWVKDDDGNKIFDSDYPKTSNPICFLTKPVLAYLNTDE